ncbi:hypothetical protein BGZ60DRAFT_157602 [Tricladium varicosporioides]|nr:hypothetical protein BGZ60DRAFT_157602 [Hymenoscyphus varicosporioides]
MVQWMIYSHQLFILTSILSHVAASAGLLLKLLLSGSAINYLEVKSTLLQGAEIQTTGLHKMMPSLIVFIATPLIILLVCTVAGSIICLGREMMNLVQEYWQSKTTPSHRKNICPNRSPSQ